MSSIVAVVGVQGVSSAPGPPPNTVRESLIQLQKLFRVRQCSESFFANRTRPCLQYQIRRCTAPCVGQISPRTTISAMWRMRCCFWRAATTAYWPASASAWSRRQPRLDYERAALLRDQIQLVRKIQAEQVINAPGMTDADVLGVQTGQGQACVAVIMIRGSRVLGSRTWFPRVVPGTETGEVLSAFIAQHYFHAAPPAEILVPLPLPDRLRTAGCAGNPSGQPLPDPRPGPRHPQPLAGNGGKQCGSGPQHAGLQHLNPARASSSN